MCPHIPRSLVWCSNRSPQFLPVYPYVPTATGFFPMLYSYILEPYLTDINPFIFSRFTYFWHRCQTKICNRIENPENQPHALVKRFSTKVKTLNGRIFSTNSLTPDITCRKIKWIPYIQEPTHRSRRAQQSGYRNFLEGNHRSKFLKL